MSSINLQNKGKGLLLGAMLGDVHGLPHEGLKPKHLQQATFDKGLLQGAVSDDTEQLWLVTQALIAESDPDRFQRRLARYLKYWFWMLPPAIGMATIKSLFRLSIGFSPRRSGVDSAGNGAAMRIAPIGLVYPQESPEQAAFVRKACEITHNNEEVYLTSLAIVRLIGACVTAGWDQDHKPSSGTVVALLRRVSEHAGWKDTVDLMVAAWDQALPVEAFACQLTGQELDSPNNKGVPGYTMHSVPLAIYAWYRHYGDFKQTMIAIYRCGGDTDTHGAIAGALAGCTLGQAGLPSEWLDPARDHPINRRVLTDAAERLANAIEHDDRTPGPMRNWYLFGLPRNLLFFVVVMGIGFKRFFTGKL